MRLKTFTIKKLPKLVSNFICSVVILLDFVFKKDKHYYTKVFLKEYKYIEKEKIVIRYNTDNLEFLYDSDEE